MYHFFVTPDQVKEGYIFIIGSDVNHIKNVLRMKPGEKIEISDGNNRKYICRLEQFRQGEIAAAIEEEQISDTELSSKIYLFQGVPKSDKMEFIIQKAVDLGVYKVIPMMTKRTVVKLDEKKAMKKAERWNSISESAAKQSGRSFIPEVASVVTLKEAFKIAGELDICLFPYELAEGMEKTRTLISAIEKGKSIGIFIGPEGGFEKEEVEEALDSGAEVITLGKRILRTETAGLAMLSILMYHLEG